MQRIEINPMTRLEGHGKITIFLDDKGNVDNAFLQVVEFMGYEKFLIGMPIEEVPRTVSTVCGVCRAVHFMASMKATDEVYGVKPTETARKLRELFYYAHYVEDHMEIIYALGLPDFVCGPTASPAERNLVGLILKVGVDVGRDVLKKRFAAVRIFEILGGRPSHPVAAIPGGWSKRLKEEERQEILRYADECVELGKFTLKAFKDLVLSNPQYVELIKGDVYKVVTNYLGTVDEAGKVTYYDGTQVFVDTKGNEIGRFSGKEYLEWIAERTLPWSYQKAPYIKKLGWKGIEDGEGTSLYSVGPLARFNVGNGFDTPGAQEAYEEMVEFFGGKPVHNILGYHWARAIELLHCAEKVKELASDESITAPDVRQELGEAVGEGVGIVEAARGTLIHHYKTDSKGIVTDANIIVATTHNKGPMNIAIKRAAENFIKEGKVDEGILNLVEIAYRPYDLCFACSTHTLPGKLPVQVNIYTKDGELVKSLRNFK
ncbi:Ni/Fe hydrogenase subunit alpha [Thermodesulfobacterium hveragerdense]|uniref:Ni/Fe hydrogenase subunit alpha n=1 Tax=Thermodesulfobacterium hveragerdense TaxID=53424 RepID=UPI0004286545|nr:Ni/Fe hydrogenase subunit alpha [Thermodesulfobacterium hveragerdense]